MLVIYDNRCHYRFKSHLYCPPFPISARLNKFFISSFAAFFRFLVCITHFQYIYNPLSGLCSFKNGALDILRFEQSMPFSNCPLKVFVK